MTTATISQIATALNISRQAVLKRATTWQPTGERVQGGGNTYDIDNLQLRSGEVKKIKAYLARSSCKIIPIHAIDKATEQAEKERLRREARAQSLEMFHRLPQWQQDGATAKLLIIQAADRFIADNKLPRKHGQDVFAHEYNLRRIDVAHWVTGEITQLHPGTLRNWISAEYELGMMGLTQMQGPKDVAKHYQESVTYANALAEKLQEVDADSFANSKGLMAMLQTMTMQGVVLDINNKKQVEAFTSLSNAIAGATQGQDQQIQMYQEMRSLMSGQIDMHSQVSRQLDQAVKQEGIYKGGLKEVVELGKQHGDTLERLVPYLVGANAAAGDINKTWSAATSSMETAVTAIVRSGWKETIVDVTGWLQMANVYLKAHSAEIGGQIREGWRVTKGFIEGSFVALQAGGVVLQTTIIPLFQDTYYLVKGTGEVLNTVSYVLQSAPGLLVPVGVAAYYAVGGITAMTIAYTALTTTITASMASNPIGWVALGIGAVTLAAKPAVKSLDELLYKYTGLNLTGEAYYNAEKQRAAEADKRWEEQKQRALWAFKEGGIPLSPGMQAALGPQAPKIIPLTGLGDKDDAKAAAAALKKIREQEFQEISDHYQLILAEQKKAADERIKIEQAAAQESSDIYKLVLQDQAKAAQEASDIYQLVLQDQAKAEKAKLEAIEKEKKSREDLYNWMVAHDPMTGALAALKEYGMFAAQIGQQTGDMVANMFYEMEDAFTGFLRTGKLDFGNFIDSLLADLARMAVKQTITGPLSSMLGSLMSGTAATYLPQLAAGSAGLLDGTSAGGLSSLIGPLASAVGLGAKAGTAAGASSGIAAGMAPFAPFAMGAVAMYAAYQFTDSYRNGLWKEHNSSQKMWIDPLGELYKKTGLPGGDLLKYNAISLSHSILDKLTGGRLFGTSWKTSASGLSLGVEDGDFFGQTYYTQKRKKSMFGGTKSRTRYGELDPLLADYLESQYGDITSAIGAGSRLLGGSGDLSGFTSAAVKINLKGKNAEAQQEAIAAYFKSLSDAAITSLYPDIAAFAKLGESASDTFQRLTASAAAVNDFFTGLDLTLNSVSLAGAAASDALVEALGGLSSAQRAFDTYMGSSLFTDAERTAANSAIARSQIASAFSGLGMTAPTTAAEYKALVNQQLALGAAGAATAAELLKLAPAFATLQDAATTLYDERKSALTAEMELARKTAELWRSAAQTLDATFKLARVFKLNHITPSPPIKEKAEIRAF